jgi:hypothetical protein
MSERSNRRDSNGKCPNPYLGSLLRNPPNKARKPVVVNATNPLNTAQAYPAYYIGIDAKEQPLPGHSQFPISTGLDKLDSASLIATAVGRASKRARSVKPRTANSKHGSAQAYQIGVDPAPGRSNQLTQYETSRPTSGRKRKYERLHSDADQEPPRKKPTQVPHTEISLIHKLTCAAEPPRS